MLFKHIFVEKIVQFSTNIKSLKIRKYSILHLYPSIKLFTMSNKKVSHLQVSYLKLLTLYVPKYIEKLVKKNKNI
jgi:hypothetical protein